MTTVSFVIPTKNVEDNISVLLDTIFNQDFKANLEVLIMDSSTDKTLEICRKYTAHLYQDLNGIASSRQMGAEKANESILAYIDSDVIVPKDFL